MMDVEINIREDMKNLGCNSEMKITLAYNLYIYLVDQKLMYDTEYCYNSDIDVLYIVAKPRKEAKLNIYVPIPTKQDISVEYIGILQDNLCTVETGPTINLAFIEGDFSMVFYTFTKGIAERLSPTVMASLRSDQERHKFINKELRSKRKEIMDDALNGGAVDDDEDCQIMG